MKKSIANKWVEALRSGKYQQAKGKLVVFDEEHEKAVGFCCLGVLGAVCGIELTDLERRGSLRDTRREQCGLSDAYGAPYNDEMEPLKIVLSVKDEETGEKVKTEFRDLAEANDNGASFETIATWIEKNYKNL